MCEIFETAISSPHQHYGGRKNTLSNLTEPIDILRKGIGNGKDYQKHPRFATSYIIRILSHLAG